MDRPIDRLYDFLETKGLKAAPAEREIGIANGYLLRQKRQGGGIGSEILHKLILAFPELNVEWLITGEGEMIKIEKTYSENRHISIASEPKPTYGKQKAKGSPLIPAKAVAGLGSGELQIEESDVEEYIYVEAFKNASYYIPVEGESMAKTFLPGDIVPCLMVNKSSFIQWNRAYVLDTTQGILLKRIRKGNSLTTWILHSDNEEYDDIEVNADLDIRSIALVLGVLGKR